MESRSTDRSTSDGLSRILQSVTASVAEKPIATLCFVGLLTIISLVVSVRFLTFKTNRADLIDPNSAFQQRWLNYTDNFGDESDVVIVIKGTDPISIKNVIDRVSDRLNSEPEHFTRILGRIEPGTIRSKSLQYLSPTALVEANSRLDLYSPILEGHWSRAGLESYAIRLNEYLNKTIQSGEQNEIESALKQVSQFTASLNTFAEAPQQFVSPWPEIIPSTGLSRNAAFETRYQLTPSGRMGFVLVTPNNTSTDFSGGAKSLLKLRTICEEVEAEYTDITIGMTGIPVLEADEMQRSQLDMMKASGISFVGVGCILLIGFRGFRHPFLALMMLAVGLSWALGFTTLVVGHLNILSVSFAAILIGLGIDFAIHYMARYLELRHQNEKFEDSLSLTSKSVGTGIVTAAVTTSLAFFCATFTNFLGVAELGIIAGGGILLCGVATFTVLPALISLADRNKETRQLPTPFQGNFLRKLIGEQPGLVATLTFIAILVVGFQGFKLKDGTLESKVQYDANLLNLQAEGLESVELQKEIFQESSGSLLYAVSIADSLPELRILKEQFLELPTVSRVEDIGSYMPTFPAEETNLIIQAMHARLSRLSDLPREFPQLDPLSIGQSMERLYETLSARKEPIAVQATAALDSFLNSLTERELLNQMQLLAEYQGAMLTALHRQLQSIEAISNPDPVTPKDFPPGVSERFVGKSGDWLLRVYPQEQVWEEEPLTTFVQAVRSVDAEATGTPLQNYEAARQIRESYFDAAIYSLLVISLVLLIDALELGPLLISLITPLAVLAFSYSLQQQSGQPIQPLFYSILYVSLVTLVALVFDFKNVKNAIFTLLPPLLGGFLMFGILGLLGIDLNPANLIVLPLILGIGVDDGVHVIHDYRHSSGSYETSASTINAITLTSLTSMLGFGSMVVAAHQGLVSLGIVLVVGVGSCLFVSLVTLPAILTLLGRRSNNQDSALVDEPKTDSEVVSIRIESKETGVA